MIEKKTSNDTLIYAFTVTVTFDNTCANQTIVEAVQSNVSMVAWTSLCFLFFLKS